MRTGSSRRWLVVTLLVASSGLNAYLLVRLRRASAVGPAPTAAPDRVAAARRLDAERQASLVALLRDFGERSAGPPARPGRPADRGDGGPGAAAQADRALLCEIAREQTRQRWEPFREDLRMVLGWYLSDPGRQERKTVEKTAEIQKLLNLGSQEAHDLLHDYAGVRRERVATVRRLLEQEPADWSGVFDQIKGLQTDEDSLVRTRFGEERSRRLHEALRGERLLALSIIASYANRPWEDAL